MPPVFASDGTSWRIPDVQEQVITAHKLVSQDGKTTLDTTNNHIDDTHLVLHGTLDSTQKYIVCKDANDVTKFKVNHDGDVVSNNLNLTDAVTGLGLTSTAQQILINANETQCDKIRQCVTATKLKDVPEFCILVSGSKMGF